MDPDNNKQGGHFDASLPLPDEARAQPAANTNPAADLIRQKVQSAYATEPGAQAESADLNRVGAAAPRSAHQQFLYELTSSGKSLAEIQQAWHEYYAGLTDAGKHQVWQEFYSVHAQASHYAASVPSMAPQELQYEEVAPKQPSYADDQARPATSLSRTLADLRDLALGSVTSKARLKPMHHTQSLLFGIGVGSVVVLIFMFSFFNERFIAPFIQPSRNVTNTPIISDNLATSTSPEIIIPKINVEIPVVYGVNTIDEASVDNALENGVVHYADTALPGQNGNLVIVGHSSNNIFNKGKYKFAFVLLSRLDSGDTFYLQNNGVRYTYQVYKKEIVKPTDVSVLAGADKPATATLITCDPPGTSANRLVVIGEQISPDPTSNAPQTTHNTLATKAIIVPGNSPSLWSRVWGWLSH